MAFSTVRQWAWKSRSRVDRGRYATPPKSLPHRSRRNQGPAAARKTRLLPRGRFSRGAARREKEARHRAQARKRLARRGRRALSDYNMIEGGRPRHGGACRAAGRTPRHAGHLLSCKARPFPFELVPVSLDQKRPVFPADIAALPERTGRAPFPSRRRTPIRSSSVLEEGKTMCSLCSRLRRRGITYRVASELSATKIALGHPPRRHPGHVFPG